MSKLELTNSEMTCYRTCPKKWDFTYNQMRIPRQTAEPLYFGSAIGLGIDAIWEGKQDILTPFKDYIERMGESHKKKLLMAKGEAMLAGYRKMHDPNEWELIESEMSVRMDVDGYAIYRGKLDKVARSKADGCLYVIDHKTTIDDIEDPLANFWVELMINSQPTGYQLALQNKYNEEVRILWDAIKKHGSRGPKKSKARQKVNESDTDFALRQIDTGETWDDYTDRLYKDYTENQSTYYKRKQIGRTSEDHKIWKDEFIANAASICNAKVIGTFPRVSSSCRKWGSVCSYASVCSGLESIESNNFVTKKNRHPELDGEEVKEELNVTV